MSDLAGLVVGAVFLGLLTLSDGNAVPSPNEDWNDDVGSSIQNRAQNCIGHYNNALKDCSDTLHDVKIKVDQNAMNIALSSKAREIEWEIHCIKDVDVGYITDRINQILRQ